MILRKCNSGIIALLLLFTCIVNFSYVILQGKYTNELCRQQPSQHANTGILRNMISTSRKSSTFFDHDQKRRWNKAPFPWNETISTFVNDIRNKINELDYLLRRVTREQGKSHIQRIGCKNVSTLYRSDGYPSLEVRDYDQPSQSTLKTSPKDSIPVEIKTMTTNVTFNSNYEIVTQYKAIKNFRKSLIEIFNLIKLRNLYGIPRLRGLCLSISTGSEIQPRWDSYIIEKKAQQSNLHIWYMISRCDVGTPLCYSANSKKCKRLESVTGYLKGHYNRSQAALTVMTNMATIFQQFSSNGVLLHKFEPSKIFICKNLDVEISDASDLVFLTNDINRRALRLLSGTSCRNSSDCPGISWPKASWQYQYAPRCAEVLGYCSFDNYCWGVDSLTHVCVFWPWIFSRLHSVVSAFWPRDKEFLELTRCVAKYYPEERCNWTYLKEKLTRLRGHASRELVGS